MQDAIGGGGKLSFAIVVVVGFRDDVANRFGAGGGDDVTHRFARLGELARRLHVGWHVAGILVDAAAQTLAIDELLVELAGQQIGQRLPHVILEWKIEKNPPVELALEAARQRRPVRTHALETLEDDLGSPVAGAHQARVTLLAAGLLSAHGRHEKAQIKGLELDFEERIEPERARDLATPPVVQVDGELGADTIRLALVDRLAEQHEQRIGVAVDDAVALGLDQIAAFLNDRVTAAGDAAG